MKTISDFVVVDGKTYRVGVISIDREAPVLDKYAERTEDGKLHREIIGTYYNYKIKFGWSYGAEDDYDNLFEILSAPEEYHMISMPYGRRGTHTYEAYISSVRDSVMVIDDGETLWDNLTASFIATKPART